MTFGGENSRNVWMCEPNDWGGMRRIDVHLTQTHIRVEYHGKEGKQTELFKYRRILEGEDGIDKIVDTPFSFMKFRMSDKIILSRTADNSRKAFTYLFNVPGTSLKGFRRHRQPAGKENRPR